MVFYANVQKRDSHISIDLVMGCGETGLMSADSLNKLQTYFMQISNTDFAIYIVRMFGLTVEVFSQTPVVCFTMCNYQTESE